MRNMIIRENWKLSINNGIFSLCDLSIDTLEKAVVKELYPKVYNELYKFHLKTEATA